MKNIFAQGSKNGFGTNRQVTGKAADAGYTAAKKAASQTANRETLASSFGLAGSGNSTAKNTSSTFGVQSPTMQTGSQRTGVSTGGKTVTGFAADARPQAGVQSATAATAAALSASNSGYTQQKKAASQTANQQMRETLRNPTVDRH